jgi:xanthine dehydrogenase YagT iron-sulfur-binding subunit
VVVRVTVNGRPREVWVEPRRTLLDLLRWDLGLTGAKPGCERGACGACTVLLDGEAVYACLVLACACDGREVLTVEGLGSAEGLDPIQEAFVEHDAFQCGYCTPGQIMAAKALLRRNPAPTEAEVREALSGNLCRCGAYQRIVAATLAAARGGTGGGAAGRA